MEDVYIRHVKLLGFEKRFYPSQHCVYMLMVKWSDLVEKLIFRTYPEIYTFHKSLKEMFPIEAGQIETKDRIIPSLPAPRWVESQRSRESKQSTLTEYCLSLITLPPHISRCSHLNAFFKVRPEDENPPAPNTGKKSEIFLETKVNNNISEISGPIILDTYRVIADFTKTSKHELNLRTGDLVEIVEKNQNALSEWGEKTGEKKLGWEPAPREPPVVHFKEPALRAGWWFCQCETKRGWVPATYLEPLDGPEETEDVEPNYEGELHVTVRSYNAETDDEISLEMGETIEVIHKLLDGWWVVRKGEETGHFPSMFLQKAGKGAKYEYNIKQPEGQKPPPRRSTIKNAKSIHEQGRQRLSQEAYRRNSRRYLQQKGGLPTAVPRKSKMPEKSPLRERKNQGNIPAQRFSSETELKPEAPVIPPRPSPELILERCTDKTCKKVSIRNSGGRSNST